MMKFFAILLLIPFFLTGCAQDNSIKVDESKTEFEFWHITDTHYLAPSLNVNSPDFTQMMFGGDGKMTHYSHEMTLAFKEEAITKKPDAILISGDLTFNGERESHIDFAKILKDIQNEGIHVFVIPGNHDIDYPFAFAFLNNEAFKTENITISDFEDIYADFGYNKAYLKDENSLSYIYKFTDEIYILGIDSSSSGNGIILDETLTWLDSSLSSLPEDVTIISMTHQSLFIHNEGFESGFVIDKHEKLAEILRKYNVELNLSGHMHIQNILTIDGLTDISTNAYSLFSTRYGIINYDNSLLSYSTNSVDIDLYAKNNNLENPDLINFSNYAMEFYKESNYEKTLDSMLSLNLTQAEAELVADFIAEMNTSYFYGDLKDNMTNLENHEGYKLIITLELQSFFIQYIDTVMSQELNDDLNWTNN